MLLGSDAAPVIGAARDVHAPWTSSLTVSRGERTYVRGECWIEACGGQLERGVNRGAPYPISLTAPLYCTVWSCGANSMAVRDAADGCEVEIEKQQHSIACLLPLQRGLGMRTLQTLACCDFYCASLPRTRPYVIHPET